MIRLLFDTPALAGWGLVGLTLQGLVVLLAFGAARRSLRSTAPERRYALAVGTLALLVLSVPLTLVLATSALGSQLAGENASPLVPAGLGLGNTPVAGLLPWFGGLWLAGFLLASLRLAIGGFRLWRLCRSSGVAPLELHPSHRLLQRAGLSRAPIVLESAEVTSPFVTGWGSGILMLPAGLIAQLPNGEREAVMLHELVHLKRGDFLVNLVQRAMTALLWFEPAVWLVGAEIERLREECCDAAVVRAVGRPFELARALVRLEELRSGTDPLALAGTGGALSDRVRRLLSDLPLGSAAGTSGWPALGLVGLASLLSASLASQWAATAASHAVPVVTISAEDPAGPFTLEMAGGVLRGMRLAGTAVPRNRLSQTGRTIHLLDARGQSQLEITVSSPGAIRWTPRPAPPPRPERHGVI